MEKIFWTGYSSDDRYAAINRIKVVVSKYGDVVDINLFSDISINLTIEIEELKIDKLYKELRKIMEIKKFEHLNSSSTIERTVYLNITFIKGTGDLKIEVPAVPG